MLRRVACDCGLVAIAHDGEALNIGRRTRSIPPAIRRALMQRDRGLCTFHHHKVHEGGWMISVEADGALDFISPGGK